MLLKVQRFYSAPYTYASPQLLTGAAENYLRKLIIRNPSNRDGWRGLDESREWDSNPRPFRYE